MPNKSNVKNTEKGNAKGNHTSSTPPKAKKNEKLGEKREPRISKAPGRTGG